MPPVAELNFLNTFLPQFSNDIKHEAPRTCCVTDIPAGPSQLNQTVKEMGVLSGLSTSVYTHAMRHGAAAVISDYSIKLLYPFLLGGLIRYFSRTCLSLLPCFGCSDGAWGRGPGAGGEPGR